MDSTPSGSDTLPAGKTEAAAQNAPNAVRATTVARESEHKPKPAAQGSKGDQNGGVKDHESRDAGATEDDKEDKGNKKPRPPWLRPLLLCVVVVVLCFLIPWFTRYWHYSQTHVSTDDAYVTGNLTNVGPIISGTLLQLTVDEGSYVKRGQLVARLDPAGPRASLRQAVAAYNAALSQIPEAERNLAYQQQSTQAAIQKAQASLAVQNSKTQGAARQLALTSGTTSNQLKEAQAATDQASAQVEQNIALVQSAQATVANDIQGVQTSQASLLSYEQQIQTAQKAFQAARSRVDATQADVDRDTKDEERYRVLYLQDAISAQIYDQAHASTRSARATLLANQALAEEAQSQVDQARANALQAQSQVEQSRKIVTQAQAQVRAAERAADAAGKQVKVEEAAFYVAKANGLQVAVQQSTLASTSQQSGESEADLVTAQAGKEQIAVRRKQIVTYRAQVAEALAALNNAQITLNDTNIYAPSDGIVVHKAVNIGVALSVGQTILTMTQGDYAWVEANFKETQLNDVVPGEPVEVEVDAIPAKTFKGHVRSINQASGTATSLLPTDNATGNFTKVVQRIPVRIEFDAASDADDPKYARKKDMQSLRQGMSVVATVDKTHVEKYRNRQDKLQNSRFASGDGGQSGPSGLPNPGAEFPNANRRNNGNNGGQNGEQSNGLNGNTSSSDQAAYGNSNGNSGSNNGGGNVPGGGIGEGGMNGAGTGTSASSASGGGGR